MYKKYINSVKERPTHERRQHALQVAGAIVIAVFLVWVATLGIRLATEDPAVAQGGDTAQNLASVASEGNATLLVSTSTDDSSYFGQ